MTHPQFNLDVSGYEGVYSATLTLGDTVVAQWEASNVKEAQKRARTLAASYLNENRPHRSESYTEQFTL
jgi:hypothetical protein